MRRTTEGIAGPLTDEQAQAGGDDPPMSIATHVERQRLEHRAGRLEHVISALEDRAVYRQASGTAPPQPLRRAIADFRIELARVHRRLAEASSEREDT